MKIRKILVLKEVADDLNEGRFFYERKEQGIGDYFFDSIISDIESLKLYGGIHNKKFGFYRMLAKRFPFAIYYKMDGDIIKVIAVLDMRRNPSWIRKKLGKRRKK